MNEQLPISLRPHGLVFWGDQEKFVGGGGNHPLLGGMRVNAAPLSLFQYLKGNERVSPERSGIYSNSIDPANCTIVNQNLPTLS